MGKHKNRSEVKSERPSHAYIEINCPYSFGYLSQRPKGEEIPAECLTCERVLDCMLCEIKWAAPSSNFKLETQVSRRSQKHAEEIFKESVKTNHEEVATPVSWAENVVTETSEDQFIVENLGMLYASWAKTVRIPREALLSWGEKVEEVEVETPQGKRARFKVQPMEGSRRRVVQIPDKAQQDLGIAIGDLVKVKPVRTPQKTLSKRLKFMFS